VTKTVSTMTVGVWILPELALWHTPTYHVVVDVVAGGVRLACRGRCSNDEIAALDTDPAHASRCVTCVLESQPQTRVRISFDLGDSVDVDARDIGGEG
jgi:hypothetical protein